MTGKSLEAVSKPLLYQAVAAPKVPQKTLLSEALKSTSDQTLYSDILCDNFGSSKTTNIENYSCSNFTESVEKNKFTSLHEKENFTKQEISDGKTCTDSEDPKMITCGKMVVNTIIDKLYSSEISLDARKTASESVVTDKHHADNTFSEYKHIGDNGQSLSEQDESNNNTKSFDEADGMMDGKSSRKRHVSQSSSMGNDSVEEGEDLHPLRKSRRRNKGQRYQMLINDGIIQPSKERMAALQKHSPSYEG